MANNLLLMKANMLKLGDLAKFNMFFCLKNNMMLSVNKLVHNYISKDSPIPTVLYDTYIP